MLKYIVIIGLLLLKYHILKYKIGATKSHQLPASTPLVDDWRQTWALGTP